MKKCKITVMKMTRYDDLIEKYENPIEHACDMKVGQVFIANGWEKPESIDAFDEELWVILVENVNVYHDKKCMVYFKNGISVEVTI